MKFQKGNKFGKHGRQNPPGGRPTNKKREEDRLSAEAAKQRIEEHAGELIDRALVKSRKSERVLLALIDKVVPDAKKAIEIEGTVTVDDLILKLAEKKKSGADSSGS